MVSIYLDGLDIIKNNINPFSNKWTNICSTNCYAYALGIDIPNTEIEPYSYIPGCFSRSKISEVFTRKELLEAVDSDLEVLGISRKIVNHRYKLQPGEWKIAMFDSTLYETFENGVNMDFHFLRQTENGVWVGKDGYYGIPSIYDSNDKIIKNPRRSYLRGRKYEYLYVKTYCLKKVNK